MAPGSQEFFTRVQVRPVAVMWMACCCGTTWPRALMGTVDRGPIIAAGSQCPDDSGWLPSIVGLTDIAITRVYPRKPSGPAAVGCLSRRRPAVEVLLARHQRPTDARQLVGHRHQLARLAGEQLGDPRIAPDVLAFDQRCRAIDQEPAQI